MRKLLSANLSRLRRDKIFWIMLLVTLGFSLLYTYNSVCSAQAMTGSGYVVSLEDYYFQLAPFAGMVFSIYISLFLGAEIGDGVLRNKLIVGHTRTQVYLANFLTCFLACLGFLAVWLLAGLPGVSLIGPFDMGWTGYFVYVCLAVCVTAAFTAIFTFAGTMCNNKALTVVVTLVVWLALLLAASGMYDRLCEPEMQGGVVLVTETNQLEMLDPTPNPMYLGGTARKAVECLMDLLPTGQAILMANAEIEHPLRALLFSLLLTTSVTGLGLACFRKKDIR